MHVIGIRIGNVKVIPTIARVLSYPAPAGARGFKRVRLQHPVAEIYEVNVLVQNDVAGDHTIPEEGANAAFERRRVGITWVERACRLIIGRAASNLAQGAQLHTASQFCKWRCIAALKPDIEA